MSSIDPYRQWLGIATNAASPDHFELLGLEFSERLEPNQVLAAARKQLDKLKECDRESHSQELHELVAAIKAAAKCLANAETRAAYIANLPAQSRRQNAAPTTDAQTKQADAESPNYSRPSPSSPGVEAKGNDIPMAIPLAKSLHDRDDPSMTTSPRIDVVGTIPASAGVAKRGRSRKRKNRWLFWLGNSFIPIAAVATVYLIRPDLLQRLIRGDSASHESVDRATTPSVDSMSNRTRQAIESNRTVNPNSNLRAPLEPASNSPNETTSSTPATPVPGKPPLNDATGDEMAALPETADSPLPPIEPETSTIAPAPMAELSDPVVEFYLRSTVYLLSLNEVDSAAEMFSRIEVAAASEKLRPTLDRLAIVANAHTTYRDLLLKSAASIPGGTTLEVGAANEPIGLVEANSKFLIVRVRGVNRIYPLALLPDPISSSILRQMQPGDPNLPIAQLASNAIANWKVTAELDSLVDVVKAAQGLDAQTEKTRAALAEWLNADRGIYIPSTPPIIDPLSPRWTEELVTSADGIESSQTDGALHDAVAAAIAETDSFRRMVRLERVKRAAAERSNVVLALCLQLEIARALAPKDSSAAWWELLESLERRTLDRPAAELTLAAIIRLADEKVGELELEQLELLRRLAGRVATEAQLDYFRQAIERMGNLK